MTSRNFRRTRQAARPLADAAAGVLRQTGQPVWRCSFDVDDARAKVGHPFGDGSVKQMRQVVTAIRETLCAWINKEVVVAIPGEEDRTYRLRWDLARTLTAVLGFIDRRTGDCIASYEMIARAAGLCRMTVIRHMRILRAFHWIDWVRRTESGEDGKRAGQAPNGYFFEISRLPVWAQIHLRQILKRQGVTLESRPQRKGSGPVPSRVERLARMVGRGLSAAAHRMTARRRDELMSEAEFARGEAAFFGDIPTDRWAALRHPDDPAAQAAYNARLGISFFDDASNRNAPDSGLQNKEKRN